MVVLIDTNVLLDFLQNRKPGGEYANKIIRMCADRTISGFMAAHSISNSFYILRKDYSVKERKTMLLGLCKIMDIVDIDKQKVITSLLNEDFADIEDCLQVECAKRINADYLITRDLSGFSNLGIDVISSEDFVDRYQ